MPSPFGHMLSGAIIGAVTVKSDDRLSFKRAGLGALVAASPDLDMLLTYTGIDPFDAHRTFSHSAVTAVIIMLGLWVVSFLVKNRDTIRFTVSYGLVGACLLAHVGLDMLGADYRGPRGLMLFWPLSDTFYYANIEVFPALSDATGNRPPVGALMVIALREMVTIGLGGAVLCAGALFLRRRRRRVS